MDKKINNPSPSFVSDVLQTQQPLESEHPTRKRKKASRSHRASTTKGTRYTRQPGVQRWLSPWPDAPYRTITVEIPLPLYDILVKEQDKTKPRKTKVQIVTEALISALCVNN